MYEVNERESVFFLIPRTPSRNWLCKKQAATPPNRPSIHYEENEKYYGHNNNHKKTSRRQQSIPTDSGRTVLDGQTKQTDLLILLRSSFSAD